MNPDYGTVAPMAPVQEHEMNQVRNVFERMADAVVQSTLLATEVRDLRQQVESLARDTEALRKRNTELDEILADVRRQRDEARSELDETKSRLFDAEHLNTSLNNQNFIHTNEIEALKQTISTLRKERDDAEYRSLEAREALDKANAKLAKFKAIFEEDRPTAEVSSFPEASRDVPYEAPHSEPIALPAWPR